MKKKSKKFSEKLTAAQIAEGMNVAEENAFRLLQDAEILYKAKRYPTACSLVLLAIEEIGKVECLQTMSIVNSSSVYDQFGSIYFTHTDKTSLILMRINGMLNLHFPDNEIFSLGNTISVSKNFDQLKQSGFYSDYLGKGRWWNPSKISEMIVKPFIVIAKRFIWNNKHSEKEIQIFQKYMGPLWGTDKKMSEQNKMDMDAELKAAGISPRVLKELEESPMKNNSL